MTNRDGYNQLQEFNEEEKYNSLLNSQNQFNPNNTGTNFYQNPNNVGGKTLIEDDNKEKELQAKRRKAIIIYYLQVTKQIIFRVIDQKHQLNGDM